MGFPRQEYWSELPFPSPGNLPDPGIEPQSPGLQADSLPSEPPCFWQMLELELGNRKGRKITWRCWCVGFWVLSDHCHMDLIREFIFSLSLNHLVLNRSFSVRFFCLQDLNFQLEWKNSSGELLLIWKFEICQLQETHTIDWHFSFLFTSYRMDLTIIIFVLCPWDSPGKNTGMGCNFLLQEIFPTQELNLGLLHCRQILNHLSHQGSWYSLQTIYVTSFDPHRKSVWEIDIHYYILNWLSYIYHLDLLSILSPVYKGWPL